MRKFLLLSFLLCLLAFCSGCFTKKSGEVLQNGKAKAIDNSNSQMENKNNPKDMLTGKNMTARDGSLLQMKDDGTYIWYQKPEITDDNYYVGTYEIYFGENAISILDSMRQYGFTMQEQFDLIERNKDIGLTKDDWYVMVQNVKERVVSGTRKDSSDKFVYAGFYHKEARVYDAVNCNTANYAVFTIEEN